MSQFLFLKTKGTFVLPLLLLGNMPSKRTVHVLLETKDLTCFFIRVFFLYWPHSKDKNKTQRHLYWLILRGWAQISDQHKVGGPLKLVKSLFLISECPKLGLPDSFRIHSVQLAFFLKGLHWLSLCFRAEEHSDAPVSPQSGKPLGQKPVCRGFTDLPTYRQSADKWSNTQTRGMRLRPPTPAPSFL